MIETQIESLKKLDKNTRYKMILEKLEEFKEGLTARELARELNFFERNTTAPRLTELVKKGMVRENGTRYDELTERNVAVYCLVEKINE